MQWLIRHEVSCQRQIKHTFCRRRWRSSFLLTWQTVPSALSPCCFSCWRAESTCVCLRLLMTTCAPSWPSRSAIARPMLLAQTLITLSLLNYPETRGLTILKHPNNLLQSHLHTILGGPTTVKPTYIFVHKIWIKFEWIDKIQWFLVNAITVHSHTLGSIKI